MPLNNQFGVQGGYMGTGVELQPELEKVYKRLLSPAEWERQDPQVRSAFGGYMNYVNAFTSRKKAKKAGTEGYLAAREGRFEPQPSGVSWGAPTSTRGRIPTAGKGGVAIPKTTIHRDIYGRPTQELAGGGVTRGIGGEVIPQTAEQIGDITDIARSAAMAIPRAKEKTAAELIRQAETGIKLGDVRFQAGRTALDRYRTSKENQAQQRIANIQDAITTRYKISENKIASKKSLARLKNDLNMERDLFKSKLASGSQKEKNEFATIMQDAKFEHDFEKQARQLKAASVLLQTRIDAAKNATEADQLFKVKSDIEKRVAKLMYFVTNQDLTDETEAEKARRARREALNLRSTGAKAATESPSITKLMTKDEFVEDFTDKKGRPPTYEETIRAEGRYWK